MGKIIAIASVSTNGIIGFNNDLIFKNSADMEFFKKTTLNSAVVMGRKTWESLPLAPLKNRLNIILSKDIQPTSNVLVYRDLKSCLERIKQLEMNTYIIGGSEIYSQFLPHCNEVLLSEFNEIYPEKEGVVRFPYAHIVDRFKLESTTIFEDQNFKIKKYVCR